METWHGDLSRSRTRDFCQQNKIKLVFTAGSAVSPFGHIWTDRPEKYRRLPFALNCGWNWKSFSKATIDISGLRPHLKLQRPQYRGLENTDEKGQTGHPEVSVTVTIGSKIGPSRDPIYVQLSLPQQFRSPTLPLLGFPYVLALNSSYNCTCCYIAPGLFCSQ